MTSEVSGGAVPRFLLPVLFLGVLMGAVDIAIVGPALPAIGRSFAVDEAALSWVFSIFTLFAVISAVPLARLSDRFGRRRLYVACLGIFTFGSLLVAVAPGFGWLLGARAVQAIGAGGIFPVASAVIGDVVPAERRGRALGMIGAVFGLAFLLGPVLGGLLLPFGWRSLFYVNLLPGLVLMFCAARVMPQSRHGSRDAVDWLGMLLLAAVLAGAALAFNRISTAMNGGWSNWLPVVVPLGVAALLAALLSAVERRASAPVVPLQMLASSQFRLIGAIALVAGVTEAGMVFLPAVAVEAFAVSEAQAAWMMAPLVVALAVVAPLAGIAVDRWSAPLVIRAGLIILAAGTVTFAVPPLTLTRFYVAGLLVGGGLAALLGAPLRHAALAATPAGHRATGQGLMSLALHAGQIVGAAAIGALLAAAPLGQAGFRDAMFMLSALVVAAALVSARLQARS